jgi:transcriptional regulator with XRE-family HTH domain
MNTLGETDQGSRFERLAAFVRARREELGMTQNELQMAGGPSSAVLRYIESGKETKPSTRTIKALERALDWEQGSVQAILSGGDPTIVGTTRASDFPTNTNINQLDELVAQLQQIMDERRLTDAPPPAISAETMDATRILAAREHRTVAEVMADAINLYAEVMGGDK